MPRPVLLHSCCAPCSSAILEWLLQHDYAPTIFYFNPNIFPQEEYLVRKNECQRYAAKLGVPFVDGDYDHALWRESVKRRALPRLLRRAHARHRPDREATRH